MDDSIGISFQENHDDAFDLIVDSTIRPNPHRILFAVQILNAMVLDSEILNHIRNHSLQVVELQVRLDVRDGPTDIGLNEIENFIGHGSKPPDAQIVSEHDDRDVDATQ